MKKKIVAIVGRPNVGKSTLLNAIIGKKIAITSNTAQTTRNMIQGIYHGDDVQIIFVDTPGIHKPHNKLGQVLNKQAYYSLNDVDVILFLVDVTEKLGNGDKFILEKLKENDVPVILGLNKMDKITYLELLPKIEEYKDLYHFSEIIPVSAYKKKNLDEMACASESAFISEPYQSSKTGTMIMTVFVPVNNSAQINSLYVSLILGLAIGAQPIIGFNYGAGNYKRVKETLRKVMITGFIFRILR